MLRIAVAEGPGQVTLKLEGSLAGPWVAELEHAGGPARRGLNARPVCVDLPGVDYVEEAGKSLLALLRRAGPQVRAAGTAMTELVRTIAEEWPPSLGRR